METKVASATKEVVIGLEKTVLIGERINPTGKKRLAAALQTADFAVVQQEAREQVAAGADILDINVGSGGVDEAALLPEIVKVVMEAVDVPLCIDSGDPNALKAALKVYQGKPLLNSVNGAEHSMAKVLPLAKEYGTAVIALLKDERGVPKDSQTRLEIAERIIERCGKMGIPAEDVIIDCLVLSVAVQDQAGLTTLETIRSIKERFGVNITLGASNISFGLPGREVINASFLAVAISAGLTCPIVDAAKVRKSVLAADLVMGKDQYARKYIRFYRQNRDLF